MDRQRARTFERIFVLVVCVALAAMNIYLGWWISAGFCLLMGAFLFWQAGKSDRLEWPRFERDRQRQVNGESR